MTRFGRIFTYFALGFLISSPCWSACEVNTPFQSYIETVHLERQAFSITMHKVEEFFNQIQGGKVKLKDIDTTRKELGKMLALLKENNETLFLKEDDLLFALEECN